MFRGIIRGERFAVVFGGPRVEGLMSVKVSHANMKTLE